MLSRPSLSRPLETFPPETHSDLVRRRGGMIWVPRRALPPPKNEGSSHRRVTKLLLNVTVERSLGAVQVVMSSEKTVADLITAVLDVYVKEMRRPLLTNPRPENFQLHYSQFSLESKLLSPINGLKEEEKLINLGSRNFFLFSKKSESTKSLSSHRSNELTVSSLSLTLLSFLL